MKNIFLQYGVYIILGVFVLFTLFKIIQRNRNRSNMKSSNSKSTLNKMMYVVALSSIAIIVGLFEIPILVTGAKMDLSEIVILISFLLLGFKGSVLVILFRSAIRFFITTMGTSIFEADPIFKLFGEGLAIAASLLIVLSLITIEIILNKRTEPLLNKDDNSVVKVSILEVLIIPIFTAFVLTFVMTIIHFYITVPLYGSMLGIEEGLSNKDVIKLLLLFFGFLNMAKGVISPFIYLMLKPKIADIIK